MTFKYYLPKSMQQSLEAVGFYHEDVVYVEPLPLPNFQPAHPAAVVAFAGDKLTLQLIERAKQRLAN